LYSLIMYGLTSMTGSCFMAVSHWNCMPL